MKNDPEKGFDDIARLIAEIEQDSIGNLPTFDNNLTTALASPLPFSNIDYDDLLPPITEGIINDLVQLHASPIQELVTQSDSLSALTAQTTAWCDEAFLSGVFGSGLENQNYVTDALADFQTVETSITSMWRDIEKAAEVIDNLFTFATVDSTSSSNSHPPSNTVGTFEAMLPVVTASVTTFNSQHNAQKTTLLRPSSKEQQLILSHPNDLSKVQRTVKSLAYDATNTGQEYSVQIIVKPGVHTKALVYESEVLQAELQSVQPGSKMFQQYEDVCMRILKYLFADYLERFRSQEKTINGCHRRDLICRIASNSSFFWHLLRESFEAYLLTFEFKNYNHLVKQNDIMITSKYLCHKARRTSAIILSRHGADANALEEARGILREDNKLILVLDDDHIMQMLSRKKRGSDPTDILSDFADDFLAKLPR